MSDLKKKELTMRMRKAEAAIAELEYKIEERKADIQRMADHIELQKTQIEKAQEEFNELED